ncbi:unnamed protein product [Ixodes pacificus]
MHAYPAVDMEDENTENRSALKFRRKTTLSKLHNGDITFVNSGVDVHHSQNNFNLVCCISEIGATHNNHKTEPWTPVQHPFKGSPRPSLCRSAPATPPGIPGSDDELGMLKRQIRNVSRRLVAVEQENQQRQQREVVLYSVGLLYFLLKGLFWLNRNW